MLEILINNIDKTSDILWQSFRISDYINQQVDVCSFECINFKPLLNQEVKISYDSNIIYGGVIVKIDSNIKKGFTQYSITCKDYTQYLNRELVSESFTNKTVTEIMTSLLAEYASDFTMVNVEGDSLISSITFNRMKVSECIEALANTINYYWYVDYEKDIHFFAENDELAPFNLTDTGEKHAWESLRITEDFSQIRNQIYVIGGEYEGEARVESYVADGTQLQFPLAYKYSSLSRVRIVGGADLTVGIDGEDEEANFQVFWSPKQKYLRFKTSNKPTAGQVVELTGLPLFQVFVKVPDIASIAEYGLYEFKIKDTSITSRADAIARGVTELQSYADSIDEASFITDTYGLRSGQTININVAGTNEDFIIQSVSMNMKSPLLGKWSVKLATVKTLGIIRFLQKYLKIEDEIVEGETLLELMEFTDSNDFSASIQSITTRTPPYAYSPITGIADSYPESNYSMVFPLRNGSFVKAGQSFTGKAGILKTCKFYLKKTGLPTGNMVAKLYSHTGTYGVNGVPNVLLATSDVIDVATLTTSLALKEFTFSTPYNLVNGTYYCITIEYAGGSVGNTLDVGRDATTPTHSGNFVYNTVTWSVNASADILFYVYIDNSGKYNLSTWA